MSPIGTVRGTLAICSSQFPLFIVYSAFLQIYVLVVDAIVIGSIARILGYDGKIAQFADMSGLQLVGLLVTRLLASNLSLFLTARACQHEQVILRRRVALSTIENKNQIKDKALFIDVQNRAIINLTQNCLFKLTRMLTETAVFGILFIYGCFVGKQIFLFIFFSIISALLIYFLITSSRLRKLGFQINQLAKDFNKEIDQAWGVKKELLIFNAANPAIGKITTLANRFANRQFTAITISNSTKLFSEFAVFVTLVVCASYIVSQFDLNYEAYLISIALLMRMAPFVAALSVFVAQLALLESVYSIVKDALNE